VTKKQGLSVPGKKSTSLRSGHAWKTDSPELRAIYEIAEHISGIYGCGSVGQASRGAAWRS
jgi:hypothetical protein